MHQANSEKRTAQISISEILDSDALPGWPVIFRLLEKQAPGLGTDLLMLGTMKKMQDTLFDLFADLARAELVIQLRTLIDIIAHRSSR